MLDIEFVKDDFWMKNSLWIISQYIEDKKNVYMIKISFEHKLFHIENIYITDHHLFFNYFLIQINLLLFYLRNLFHLHFHLLSATFF